MASSGHGNSPEGKTLLLSRLRGGETLRASEIYSALSAIAEDQISPAQIGAFLMALSLRGETAEELAGAARFLREMVQPVVTGRDTVDCCGTGGDLSSTLNISTAAALIVASCGVPVTKHGNRAASSKSGAADVLEAMDVNLDITPLQCSEALNRFNFCFLMAPSHHRVLRPLSQLRKELGFRTLFNLIGPLANPAGANRQLIGVYARHLTHVFAETLQKLGTEAAWIVHGEDGLDEITLTGSSFVSSLESGTIRDFEVTPEDFGLGLIALTDIKGGTAAENADALFKLLHGEHSAYRDIALANAAASLVVSGRTDRLKDGVAICSRAIDDGHALTLFQNYRDFTKAG